MHREFFSKPERQRLSALILEIQRLFAEKQLPVPNYRTVVRRIEALDLRLVTARREGTKKARQLLDPVSSSFMQPGHPMDLLQIDRTPVDVVVVFQQKRLPIGTSLAHSRDRCQNKNGRWFSCLVVVALDDLFHLRYPKRCS